ncbi:hypothetical protein CLI64_25700 [Nostoc sp. CENA543]|nr:hypothetical protein CLI64_25700 [Nostoc sp. CENA543]
MGILDFRFWILDFRLNPIHKDASASLTLRYRQVKIQILKCWGLEGGKGEQDRFLLSFTMPNSQSPIPSPQSPIPIKKLKAVTSSTKFKVKIR